MEQSWNPKDTAEKRYKVWEMDAEDFSFFKPFPTELPSREDLIQAASVYESDKDSGPIVKIKTAIRWFGIMDTDSLPEKLRAIDNLTKGMILSGLDNLIEKKKASALESYRVNGSKGGTAVRNLVQDLGLANATLEEKLEAVTALKRETLLACIDIAAEGKVMSTTSEYHVFNGQRNGLLAELYNLCNSADSDGWAGEGSKGIPEGIGLRAAEWLNNLDVAERGYLPNEVVVEAGSGCIVFRWRNLKKKVELTFGAEIDCVYYKGNIPQDVIQNLVPASDRVSDGIKSKINMMWSG